MIDSENDLWRLIIQTLNNGLFNNGKPNIKVLQNYPATSTKTANKDDSIYIHKIDTMATGESFNKTNFNELNDNFDAKEIQKYSTTFQLTTDINEDNNPNSYTSLDIITLCYQILNSRHTLDIFLNSSVDLEKINTIRSNINLDETDQYRNNYNFDFVINYELEYNQTIDRISKIEENKFKRI